MPSTAVSRAAAASGGIQEAGQQFPVAGVMDESCTVGAWPACVCWMAGFGYVLHYADSLLRGLVDVACRCVRLSCRSCLMI